jgi:integrase
MVIQRGRVIQRVWKRGRVKRTAWGYTLQVDGKQERRYDAAWTREDAERELATRKLGLTAPAAPHAAKTLGVMVTEYLAQKEARGKKTIRNDRMATVRLLRFFGDALPLTEITAQRIAQYEHKRLTEKSERLGRPVGPASLNRDLSILRGMLRMATEWEYIAKPPKIRLVKEPQGRLEHLTEDEATRLLTECQRAATYPVASHRSPHLHAIVTVALNTGLRLGEVLGLTWGRVDFSRGVILLEQTKNGRRREVPMNRAVDDVLSPLARAHGGRVFGPRSVRRAFESACERAKLINFHFHDLRHTFASWLVMRGRPLKEVQELLGHQTITMTMRYAHLSPDRLRDAVASLDDFSACQSASTRSAHEAAPAPASPVSTRQD